MALVKTGQMRDNRVKERGACILHYRLIAFDLDGTLLDSRKNLPEENRRAMEAAAEAGLLLVPATGRIYRGIPESLKSLPFIQYYILSNGAVVYDAKQDRILYRGDVPVELALRCYEYLDTLPVLYDCYQNERGWITRSMLEAAPPYFAYEPEIMKLLYGLRIPVDDLKQTLRERGEPLQKIQCYFLPEDEELRLRQLTEIPRRFPELVATTSVSNNIEINSINAGKGKALSALCEILGFPAAEAVAFGDGSNDAEMLRAAGLGVAMENAMESVKAVADELTASCDEAGVGKTIWRLLAEQTIG